MKLSEAYAVLGLKESASEDEVKKKARQMMATLHPDVNKTPTAEKDFKRVNEAFERIKSGEPDRREVDINWATDGMYRSPIDFNMPGDLSSIFEQMFRNSGFSSQTSSHVRAQSRKNFVPCNVSISIDVTFEESVLGSSKEVEFDRFVPCVECSSVGTKPSKDACKACGGTGYLHQFLQNGFMSQTVTTLCAKCGGRASQRVECEKCSRVGHVKIREKKTLKIPPGVEDGSSVAVAGGGNDYGNVKTDLIVKCRVVGDRYGMRRVGKHDVESTVKLSLRDAVFGTTVKVRTVKGDVDVVVPKWSKHSDVVPIVGHGVPNGGVHRVVLDVSYPIGIEKMLGE